MKCVKDYFFFEGEVKQKDPGILPAGKVFSREPVTWSYW
jgi:hypothetical protein